MSTRKVWNARNERRLHSAAPALLKALKQLLRLGPDLSGELGEFECYCGSVMGGDGDLNEKATCVVCMAHKAIRKAEGTR